ncbi:MAG: hypothetical protein HOY71_31690, partial [Nonomuraea sp.]|nr:hypothetical protein [Nonomuraea sp.]
PQSATWPDPQHAPNRGPVPDGMVDWFAEGAAALAGHFRQDATVWTWSAEQSVAFWRRIQAIEAALHRWDAQLAVTGSPEPLDAGLAADAVAQTFEVMAPARRAWRHAPPGQGERYLLRQSDGPGRWAYAFQGDAVDRTETGAVELTGTASDLALFLWQRIPWQRLPAERLAVKGDESLVDRYFTLVPPV